MQSHELGAMHLLNKEPETNLRAFPEIPYTPNYLSNRSFKNTTTAVDALRRWLKDHLPEKIAFSMEEAKIRGLPEVMAALRPDLPHLQFVPPRVDRIARFIVAICGGLSRVVPMIIMRICADMVKSLVTTSIAVFLFAGTLSLLFKASDVQALAATAAYAAVLVVVVGTSGA